MSTKKQCEGVTKKGIQCKNKAKYGQPTCGIHCFQKFIDCGICLETINLESPQTHKLLDCKHNFCKKCINTWIIERFNLPNCSCPLCRAPITMNSPRIGSLAITLAFDWGFKNNIIYEYIITEYPLSFLSPEEYSLFNDVVSEVNRITGIMISINTFRIFSIIAIQYNAEIKPIIEIMESKSKKTSHYARISEGTARIKDYDMLI